MKWAGTLLLLLIAFALSVPPAQAQAPANDDFADAQTIELQAPGSSTISASNRAATSEAGERNHAGRPARRSLWYHFVAPSDGTMVIDTAGSTTETVVGVYTGDGLDGLTEVTSDGADHGTAAVRFKAREGVSYAIAVDGWYETPGNLRLALSFDRAPGNDSFASSQDLGMGSTASATGDTSFATHEEGEPPAGFNPWGAASVWYSWTAPSTGTVTVDTANSSFDTVLGAFAGDRIDELTLHASNDDATDDAPGGDNLTSRLKFRAEAGQTYRIAVDGRSPRGAGRVELHLALAPGPANDPFASPRDLGSGTLATAQDDSTLATREPGEPKPGWSFGDASLWYTWTAPFSGGVTVDTLETSFNTVMAVYTGDRLDRLTRLAYNDDGVEDNAGSRVRLRVEAGTTYRFVVDGRKAPDAGLVKLRLSLAPPPSNDPFASPLQLPPLANVSQRGTNVGASAEGGEPGHGPEDIARHSTWHSWTAPSRGSLQIRTSSDFGAHVSAYTGDSLEGLRRVPLQVGSDWPERIRIRVERGVVYRIAVDGPDDPNEREGDYDLQLALSDIPENDDFADAISLGSASRLTLDGHNRGATQEPGEPVHGEGPCDPSVWYSWTAPATSDVTLSTADSQIRPVLGIYTGDSVGSLTRVPSTRTTTTYSREVRTFRATAGITYRFAVDSACGEMGDLRLALTSQALPADPPDDPPPPRPQPSSPGPGPAPAQPALPPPPMSLGVPLDVAAVFSSQRLRGALRRGVRGKVTCNRGCRLRVTATIEGPASARRGLRGSQRIVARALLRADAGSPARVVLRLSRLTRRRLVRARSARLKLRIAAASGAEREVFTRRVRLGR